MTIQPLFQVLDAQLEALLPPLQGIEHALDQHLAGLFPGLAISARTLMFEGHSLFQLVGFHLFDGGAFRVPTGSRPRHADYPVISLPLDFNKSLHSFCHDLRQALHARLANYWMERGGNGLSRLVRLASHLRDRFEAEIRLRMTDQTLSPQHAQLLRTCIQMPYPWQRRQLPADMRPQIYRILLSSTAPNWRGYLPGFLVLTEQSLEGGLLEPHESVGRAMLCSIAHGIEAFDSLTALHQEVCERLEDPQQSEHLVKLMIDPAEQHSARQAERLRYDWYTDDLADYFAYATRDAQIKQLSHAWQTAWNRGQQRDIGLFDQALAKALDWRGAVSSKGPMANRYGQLLEKHLPNWLRKTSAQGVAHIMQAMQEQIAAIEGASGPGILTLDQFTQRHSLLHWVNERLSEYLQRDPGLDIDPRDISVSVTLARQKGPFIQPQPTGITSSYIPVASRPQVGDTVELVQHTYRLEELALLNIAWFDVDYWLTARVHVYGDQPLPALTPARVKDIVRRLNAGSGYQAYLRTQLLDSAQGRWREKAHGQLMRTRMNAEAVKARYAGHFLEDASEQGYGWAHTVIHSADSQSRPPFAGHAVHAQQLLINEDTLQGVVLLVSPQASRRIVVYCPDVPDRLYWREYSGTRALIKAVRGDLHLQAYLLQRLPTATGRLLEKRLRKGGLGSTVKAQTITGELWPALYRAEVNGLMSETDTSTRSNQELLGEFSVNVLRLVLDIVSLVLPQRAMIALAFGRMSISIWDGFEAFEQGDHEGALHHAIAALGHGTAGLNEMAGSGLMRRALRGLPKPPPVPLPRHYEAVPERARLRYRIDTLHGEAVYELPSAKPGLSQYYVQDDQGVLFNVSYDGRRWRATDPDQPFAFLKLPIKRKQDGNWTVDSPVLWYDGLPDLARLLEQCSLIPARQGSAIENQPGLFAAGSLLYLQLGSHQLPVRQHLLAGHYHLLLPDTLSGAVPASAVLQQQGGTWRIRVRQSGRSSDWLALPAAYSDSRGSSRSRR
ncbi:dermonecrotic toxin domain-containing protein [Pseudomonas sp. CC120222-01a]|uniref:dermonecrotic toxin domain-containing protein n=1 Tax=Pseudomonas sp. CC120222-01a TaxID=1378075 RepID=UPI000D8C5FC2|nr:DUF6543 domain-containing protein [Pseudomonas sp. CC120222-01a]PVZ37027.1 hypothetical protein N430_04483 [Pseudomonas sp. CC120222-01a]